MVTAYCLTTRKRRYPAMSRRLVIALVILFVTMAAGSAAWAEEYQYPKQVGLVNDFAGLLSGEQREELSQRIVAFNEEIWVTLVLATVESLDGQEPVDYARGMVNGWTAEYGNGILILVAKNERRACVRFSYGFATATDGSGEWAGRVARKIVDKMNLLLEAGRADEAVLRGVDTLMEEAVLHYRPNEPEATQSRPEPPSSETTDRTLPSEPPVTLPQSSPSRGKAGGSWLGFIGFIVVVMALAIIAAKRRR